MPLQLGWGSRAKGTLTAWTVSSDVPNEKFSSRRCTLLKRQWRRRVTPLFFETINTNPNHVLRNFCTLRPTIQYYLRPIPHSFFLPTSDKINFLSHVMSHGS